MKRWRGGGAARSSLRGHYRDRALSSRERKVEQPWVALDRDGSGCEPSLDARNAGPCLSCA